MSQRLRNRAACRRCQRRKIRCDGNTPACSACQRAGTACINDGKQEVHRSYIANMENRIKWLEAIVREKCSDVDLNQDTEGQSQLFNDTMHSDTLSHMAEDHASNQHGTQAVERQDSDAPNHVNHLNHGVPTSNPQPVQEEPHQAHEIGLVSLSPGGDPRYIGPSSGYFFAKRIFSNAGWNGRQKTSPGSMGEALHLPVELLNTPSSLPPQKQAAMELSSQYFRTVHLLYPFLHEQTHMKAIDGIYEAREENPIDSFQVYMVLAIASLDLSRRRKIHLPVEGYYASAMKHVDFVCHHGSLPALQCLLLLMVYALYHPSCNINIWNLNYQCLASVIDLGLQRDVRSSPAIRISLFEQEMRTRVFWVVYTLDRTVCTMMGRPIGIRDEACERRLPLDISDFNLFNNTASQATNGQPSSHMAYSIHLFKLAQLNSEIKYVMHSVRRDVPAYAFPPVRDILAWQEDMITSLRNWISEVPQIDTQQANALTQYCQVKYHETMILVLRPSPGIPHPADEMYERCFHHSFMLIQSFGELYAAGNLPYSRLVVHAVFLGTLVMLHCIWKLPGTAATIRVNELITKLSVSQNILSSIGEHWAEATRARDCLAELASVTIPRLLSHSSTATKPVEYTAGYRLRDTEESLQRQDRAGTRQESGSGSIPEPYSIQAQTTAPTPNLFDDLLQGDQWSGISDIDSFMWEFINS
ncbi:fungal-specific transcription factor domain-containing protein, partial [Aspergillus floccosus]